MPLARMAMHNSGEHIHVAVWPTAHDLHQLCSRTMPLKGVASFGRWLNDARSGSPAELKSASETQSHVGDWLERGGSAIIGPHSLCCRTRI